jgi:hypothetical protein
MDLLNLARTTKAFRQLLMRKSSAFVWKAALGQVEGLPDCPPDLSEPQYTNLVFYPHCHVSLMVLLHRTFCEPGVTVALQECCADHSLVVASQVLPVMQKITVRLTQDNRAPYAQICNSLRRREQCADPVHSGGLLPEEMMKVDSSTSSYFLKTSLR